MKSLSRYINFSFSLLAVALLLFGDGMMQAVEAETQSYTGKANLCAIDNSKVTVETKGSKTITRNMVFVYEIRTDHPFVSGWEVMTFDSTVKKDGSQYSEGESYFVPDGAMGGPIMGSWREEFDILVNDPIYGKFNGMGSLDGMTVDYKISVNPAGLEFCYQHPYCVNPWTSCQYLYQLPGPDGGDPVPFGYDISGEIYDLPEN